jgi:hypothetical protein
VRPTTRGEGVERCQKPTCGDTLETSVHPSVIKILLGVTAWFLLVTWFSFARGGVVNLNLTIAILCFLCSRRPMA